MSLTSDQHESDTEALDDLCRQQFPLEPDLCYLNHAAVGPWPKVTAEAVKKFAEENMHFGALHYLDRLKLENTLRSKIKRLINCVSSNEIALCKNTSDALSMVAYGLEWLAGDEVVIFAQEFPSNRIVWESLTERFDVKVRLVDLFEQPDPVAAILNTCGNKTRLVSISSVHYGSGICIDLKTLGRELKKRGILFCVDAIQSLGVMPMNVETFNIDFLTSGTHKWLLAPEGMGIFYIAARHIEKMQLHNFGWHMVAERGDYDRTEWQPAPNASRFESGSPNMLGAYALDASLGLLLDVGIPRVHAEICRRVDYLNASLSALDGIQVYKPYQPHEDSGILSFTAEQQSSESMYKALMERKVVCAHRNGRVRFSPHFYTPFQVLDDAVATVRELIQK